MDELKTLEEVLAKKNKGEGKGDGIRYQKSGRLSRRPLHRIIQHVAARRPPPEGRICEANVLKA